MVQEPRNHIALTKKYVCAAPIWCSLLMDVIVLVVPASPNMENLSVTSREHRYLWVPPVPQDVIARLFGTLNDLFVLCLKSVIELNDLHRHLSHKIRMN